jgi:hypothetical protein
MLRIRNNGENLLYDDETKSESLTENLIERLRDDGLKLSDTDATLVTPSYAYGVLPYSCDSPVLMRFSHADTY